MVRCSATEAARILGTAPLYGGTCGRGGRAAPIAGRALPDRYRLQLERYRYGPGSYKVDYALDGPVPWSDRGYLEEFKRRGDPDAYWAPGDGERVFFQRSYDRDTLERRLLRARRLGITG